MRTVLRWGLRKETREWFPQAPRLHRKGVENNVYVRRGSDKLPDNRVRGEIALFQDVDVVCEVAADDVDEGVDADRAIAGDAGAGPSLGRESAQQRERSEPHDAKLLDQIRPSRVIRLRTRHGDLLIETRQRIRKPARKPQRPAEKDSFAVVDVVQQLANRPLVRRVAMRRLLFRNAFQKRQRLFHLL